MKNPSEPSNTIAKHLERTKVKEVYMSGLLTVYEGWSIRKLSQFFLKYNLSLAPVVASDEVLVGIVSQSDIVRFESKTPSQHEIAKIVEQFNGPFGGSLSDADLRRIQDRANDYCTVNSIMTPHVWSVDVNDSVKTAFLSLRDNRVSRLFVTENERLVGMISSMDILSHLSKN